MKLFQGLVLKLDVTSARAAPVSAAALTKLREDLHAARLAVSGAATAAMALSGVSLLADMAHASIGSKAGFVVALVALFVLRHIERKGLAASLEAVEPVPDDLCAEMAALAKVCEPARQYVDAVRAQGREFVRAEYDAVRDAVHRLVVPAAGRQALYGR